MTDANNAKDRGYSKGTTTSWSCSIVVISVQNSKSCLQRGWIKA